MIQLRPGTLDSLIFREVVIENEYRLPDRLDGKTVLDVGGHIGCFALACLVRGARMVHSFESDPENYACLMEHRDNLAGLEPHHQAVWRSDQPMAQVRVGKHAGNEAANGPFSGDRELVVPAVAFDTLIDQLQPDLVKIDAEGSEYPILFKSDSLVRVRALCGEWHNMPHCNGEEGVLRYEPQPLREHLQKRGFTVNMVLNRACPGIGLFWAWRGENLFLRR